jgi:hypothetical protein
VNGVWVTMTEIVVGSLNMIEIIKENLIVSMDLFYDFSLIIGVLYNIIGLIRHYLAFLLNKLD